MRTTCPAHLTFLNLKILIIFGEQYKLRNSSMCNFEETLFSLHFRSGGLGVGLTTLPCEKRKLLRSLQEIQTDFVKEAKRKEEEEGVFKVKQREK
jgi:hypothetical protein